MSRKGLDIFAGLCAVIEASAIGACFASKKHDAILGIVSAVIFFVMCLDVALSTLLFKVEGIGSIISVRTRMGRCFRIPVPEVTQINCETYLDKGHGCLSSRRSVNSAIPGNFLGQIINFIFWAGIS